MNFAIKFKDGGSRTHFVWFRTDGELSADPFDSDVFRERLNYGKNLESAQQAAYAAAAGQSQGGLAGTYVTDRVYPRDMHPNAFDAYVEAKLKETAEQIGAVYFP